MAREEFERELEQYLAQRRKAKIKFPALFSFKKKKKMHEQTLPPEIERYDETTPAEQPATLPGEESVEEAPPKNGFWARLGMRLGVTKTAKAELSTEEVQQLLAKDEVNQDMKEIAKVALMVIKQLPSEQLSSFKASPEFERLKDLLRKHNLIK